MTNEECLGQFGMTKTEAGAFLARFKMRLGERLIEDFELRNKNWITVRKAALSQDGSLRQIWPHPGADISGYPAVDSGPSPVARDKIRNADENLAHK